MLYAIVICSTGVVLSFFIFFSLLFFLSFGNVDGEGLTVTLEVKESRSLDETHGFSSLFLLMV